MMKIEDLEGVKLVNEEYLASEGEVRAVLENAFQQGSQGWGVRRDTGVILKLARDLKLALAMAQAADEATRKLKGLQLENGRLKKAAKEAESRYANYVELVDGALGCTDGDDIRAQIRGE